MQAHLLSYGNSTRLRHTKVLGKSGSEVGAGNKLSAPSLSSCPTSACVKHGPCHHPVYNRLVGIFRPLVALTSILQTSTDYRSCIGSELIFSTVSSLFRINYQKSLR